MLSRASASQQWRGSLLPKGWETPATRVVAMPSGISPSALAVNTRICVAAGASGAGVLARIVCTRVPALSSVPKGVAPRFVVAPVPQ